MELTIKSKGDRMNKKTQKRKPGRPKFARQARMIYIAAMMTREQVEILERIERERGGKASALRFLLDQYNNQTKGGDE